MLRWFKIKCHLSWYLCLQNTCGLEFPGAFNNSLHDWGSEINLMETSAITSCGESL